jgi:hypothetical protein
MKYCETIPGPKPLFKANIPRTFVHILKLISNP